jgi:SNF2 family DNA or RNA helicase
MMEENTVKLKDFLERHGARLGEKIEQNLTPVYNPLHPEGVEEYGQKMLTLLRKPFPVQAEVIKGISKALYRQGRHHLFVCGEMGTGKSLISLATVGNVPTMRALVVCPPHLVEKWIREAQSTIPGVHAVDLTVKNVISVLHAFRHERNALKTHEVHVISKEKAKLSYAWRPAAVTTKRSLLPHCPHCGQIAMKDDEYLTFEEIGKRKTQCRACGNPLWQADRSLRRFAPAEYIKKYLKGFYDMVIIDEIQDYKAEGTLQGRAMGALLSSSRYALCLTGTLNSGYCDDLFHLLFRMDPVRLKADGFNHEDANKFLSTYGTIETVRKLDEEDNVYGRGKKKAEMVRRRPGVSPVAIGKYLLDKTVFIRLADVIDGLPPYEETVLSYAMDKRQAEAYGGLQERLKRAVKAYKTKALGSMLQALLSYPDSCVQFPENISVRDRRADEVLEVIEAPVLTLAPGDLLPKEKDFIGIVKKERDEGRKVLCYLTFTNSRDIRPRLKTILEEEKIRVGVLEPSIPPKRREEWVQKHSSGFDVLLTNAELVKTGLDLYDYPTICSFQTGYNIFTLRQAARRSWRIGQTVPVRVYFAVYRNTMQEIALSLIAKKLEVALMVEGELPEGLADYASSGGSIVQELGKALIEGGDYTGAEKAWANFRKKEIEAQLGVRGTENVFYEKKAGSSSRTTVQGNITVKVSFIEGKKKSRSVVEVDANDLDTIAAGRMVQFALF